jgi:hypothetical protein
MLQNFTMLSGFISGSGTNNGTIPVNRDSRVIEIFCAVWTIAPVLLTSNTLKHHDTLPASMLLTIPLP